MSRAALAIASAVAYARATDSNRQRQAQGSQRTRQRSRLSLTIAVSATSLDPLKQNRTAIGLAVPRENQANHRRHAHEGYISLIDRLRRSVVARAQRPRANVVVIQSARCPRRRPTSGACSRGRTSPPAPLGDRWNGSITHGSDLKTLPTVRGKSLLLHIKHANDRNRALAQACASLMKDALRHAIALLRHLPVSRQMTNLELAEGRAINRRRISSAYLPHRWPQFAHNADGCSRPSTWHCRANRRQANRIAAPRVARI